MIVMYLQWKVGDHCLAVWSNDLQLYKARIIEADEQKTVCKVKYDEYDEEEERPWVTICPLHDRHYQSRQRLEKREGNRQVVVYIAR